MESQPQVVVVSAASTAGPLIHPLQAAGYGVRVVSSIEAWCDETWSARPRCVVIDVEAGADDAPGPDTWERLRDRQAAVVIVYGGNDLRFVVSAMREGAVDLLPAPAQSAALVAAVAQGVARAAMAHSEAERGERARALLARCTPRERTVLVRATRGMLNKAIADELACQESTVKVHRSRAMRKLGLRSLADLVRLVELAGNTPVPASGEPRPRRIGSARPPSWTESAYPASSPGD